MKSVDGVIKGLAEKIGEQEKGFGLLNYNKDDRTARASHILLSFEDYPQDGLAMASALKQKILEGELEFETVAQKFSSCSTGAQGGDLGTFARGEMVDEVDAAVFKVDDATPIGSLQGPIQTVFGYHLVKVVERSGE